MDVQVLVGVVVVHVDGDLEVHTADGVHQRLEACQIHGHGEVHGDAQLLSHDVRQLLHAAAAEGGVDLVVFAVPDGLGVPGDADAVDAAVFRVHAQEDVGVAVAVAVVGPGEQDGVEVVLPLQVGGPGQGLRVLLRCLLPGGLVRIFGGDRLLRRYLRRTEEAEVGRVQGGGRKDGQK